MALFKISKGLKANLPTKSIEGYCYVTTDDHKFYVDLSDAATATATSRICLNAEQADRSTDGVEYIVGTQTASTGTWTGKTRDSALYVGKTIAYKLPFAGSGNASLILTLANGSDTPAYPVYAGNTRLTTHYPVNSIMIMVWNGSEWRTNPYYNTNTNTLLRTYASSTNIDVPLLGQSSAASETATWTAYSSGSKDWYGVIPSAADKQAKINLSTGRLTATSFAGVGSDLTQLNADYISSGTLNAARLPYATASAAGAIKVGNGLEISAGTLNVSTATGSAALQWGSSVTLGTVGGLAIKAQLPANPNVDTKVTQSNSTTANWRKILLHYQDDIAYNTAVTSSTAQVYAAVDVSVQPSTGTIKAKNISAARALNNLITGSGTAAKDAGSGDNRYQPAKWTFNTGTNVTDGEVFTIKIPVAGHSYGVYMSVNNGTNYYPVVLNGTSRVTTHYPVNTYLQVIFEASGSAASIYPLAGGTATQTVTGGVFRVINYYDANTNTLLRTYASATNIDVPLIGSSSANSTTAAWTTYTATYKDWYGVIPNDDTKRAKINLSTGKLTAASFSGNGSALTELNASNITTGTLGAARLPVATASALGGIKVGTGLTISDGTLNVSQATGSSTLSWNTETTLATIAGVAIKAKLPANPNTNTDTLVKQTAKTDNTAYKLLGTATASPTSGNAAEAIYDASITINPSTHTITANNFSGLASKATAANVTSTANAIAYYTNASGTFGTKASANGALYATSANGALQWGTLPVAQGGTGLTTAAPNVVFAGPASGSTNVAPTWRKLVAADLPTASTSAAGIIQIGTAGTDAAAGNHTHSISLTKAGTATITLAASTTYTLSAGGNSVVFTTPPNTTYTAANAAPTDISPTAGAQGTSTNYARQDHTHKIALATGDSNGQVKIAGSNVSVKGLGSAAYTASTAYAAASHSHSYLPLSGGIMTGTISMRLPADYVKGTAPTSTSGAYIAFTEPAGTAAANRLGMIYSHVTTANQTNTYIYAYQAQAASTTNSYFGVSISSDGATKRTNTNCLVYGAVWNDYAEYRMSAAKLEPGRVVIDQDNGKLQLATERLMAGTHIVSDTFGFAIGETSECDTPVAVAGRVLVYTYQAREKYHAGMAVCSAPNGTVDIMTRDEIITYPERIVGVVSEIPDYETWGEDDINVNQRIWIKVK